MRHFRHKSRLALVLLFALLKFCAVTLHAQQKPEQLAQASAGDWLTVSDAGKYGESWDQAAGLFKAAVTKDQWEQALHATRAPLGNLVSRTLQSATFAKSLPGVPDGEYVVIKYDTRFEHKLSAVETVTPTLDKDGKWRVSGYYIQ
jgi:hypothetical protein